MKNTNIFSIFITFLVCFSFLACNEEEVPEITTPTTINLSNSTLYEKLPIGTIIALLSTDIEDNTIQYRLISGEGDENNDQFEIRNGVLSTRTVLLHKDGADRQIRVQAILGETMFEKALTININEFSEVYPTVSSSSFSDGELMPQSFGFNAGNVSPDLEITNIPSNTVSMSLTMRDLDDSNSWHWAVWNIPSDKARIGQNVSWQGTTVVGDNDFGTGYVGPFPPSEHRYEITIYYLEDRIDLVQRDYGGLPTAMVGKIIAQTSIIGLYRP